MINLQAKHLKNKIYTIEGMEGDNLMDTINESGIKNTVDRVSLRINRPRTQEEGRPFDD